MDLTSNGGIPLQAVCTVDTESLLTPYLIKELAAAIVLESRDVAQRTERHGTAAPQRAVKDSGSTPQSLQFKRDH